MKTILHTSTLFYYDGPQVFEARDDIGGHYVAVMVEPEDEQDRYLVKGVAPERLRQFRCGTLDLRSLLVEMGDQEWYLTVPESDLCQPLSLVPQKTPLRESEFLPDEGFVLDDYPTEDHVLMEAQRRNNLVLEIIVDPPEAAEEHRIRVDTFVGLLDRFQKIVKHACRAARRDLPDSERNRINPTDAHLMDVVVPAAAGSFRVVLEAARLPEPFGNGELPRALQLIGELFENAANPQQSPETLRKYRGHLAGSYVKFVNFPMQHKTGVRYSWVGPQSTKPNHSAILEPEIEPLVEALSKISDLSSESVTLVGEFVKVNRDAGGWGLNTEEGPKSGKVAEGGPSLDGLEVGKRYTFFCVEEIEEVAGTGKESCTLYLKEYKLLRGTQTVLERPAMEVLPR